MTIQNKYGLVDDQATPATKKLFNYLKTEQGKHLLFGHQNTTSWGATIKEANGDESDIKATVGDFPAVYGWDTLCFVNEEGTYNELLMWMQKAANRGGIVTISGHMPNFATGGNFNDVTGNPVQEILKDGTVARAAFHEHLDLLAKLAKSVILPTGELLPIIFRPFHEHSGSWFWWGKDHCSTEEFNDLFRYTVVYLRDTKDVHNILYAYSPNGHFENGADYLSRYPGDDYVDLLGFDVYHDKAKPGDGWLEAFIKDCQIITQIADKRGKLAAITEIGLRWNAMDGIAPSGNQIPDWYTNILNRIKADEWARKMSYMLNWWNLPGERFWVPYGEHEMVGDFKAFYKDEFTIFNKDLKDIYK